MAENTDIPRFENNPIMVLVLTLVTCGLYLLYWNMKTAEVMNAVAGKQLLSPTLAAVGGCCMPLNIYFYYLLSQNLDALAARTGNAQLKEKSTIILVLGILFVPAAAMILQTHINELYKPQA